MSKARDIADGKTSGGGGVNNLIINGEMAISQRIAADTDAATNNTYNCMDRWYCTAGWSVVNQKRDTTDAPEGFANCLHVSSATGVSALGSTTNWSTVQQLIEGHNIAHLNWGTADAQKVTLSFWVKASQAGDWSVAFNNNTSNSLSGGTVTHSYVATYTVDAADTWEYKTITIDGPTVGSWNSTNGAGLTIYFNLGSGSDYTGTTTGSWVSGKYVQTSSTNNLYTGNNQYLKLTGVSLVAGDTAPEKYPHRPYGDELARCERYYQRIGESTGAGTYSGMFNMNVWSSSNLYGAFNFPKMRAAPTAGFVGTWTYYFGGTSGNGDPFASYITQTTIEPRVATSHGASIGRGGWIRVNSGGYLELDAEL